MPKHMRALLPVLSLSALLALPACTPGEDEDTIAEETAPPVDPRLVSADSALEYFNTLNTASPINSAGVLEMSYAENENQKKLMNLMKKFDPAIQVDAAFRARFNLQFDEFFGDSRPSKPAAFSTHDDQRASASYVSPTGKKEVVQFVKIGNRWWLSGYTYEDDPKVVAVISDPKKYRFIEIFSDMLNSVAPPYIRRLRGGEFFNADEARSAFKESAALWRQSHPDAAQEAAEIMQSNVGTTSAGDPSYYRAKPGH